MKPNNAMVATKYSTIVVASKIEYGWYESGRAFIAKNDEVLTYKQAYEEFVPKQDYNLYDAFYGGGKKYKKTTDGIVRYLIDKHNR